MNYCLNDGIFMRPFTVDDMRNPKYINAFHDSDVTRYNSHGLFPYTKTKQEAFAKELQSDSRIVWGLEKPNNGKYVALDTVPSEKILIGNCTLQSINWINRSAEFAIVIWDKDMWGKDVAKGALKKVLKHAFINLGLNRVWSGTAETNMGMRKVFEDCGFTSEGFFDEGMFLQGAFVDIHLYRILAKEYNKLCIH